MTPHSYQASTSDGRRKYLTASENERFLKAASECVERDRLLCETLYYAGCRVSEALAIKLEDVDDKDFTVRILCLKKRGKEVTRCIHLPEWLAKALLRLSGGAKGRLWEISRTTAWRIVKRVMAAAGISGLQATCKGLRHAFGIRAALAKVPLGFIQRCMGHAHHMTTSIYLDVKDEEARHLTSLTWSQADLHPLAAKPLDSTQNPAPQLNGQLYRDLRAVFELLSSIFRPGAALSIPAY